MLKNSRLPFVEILFTCIAISCFIAGMFCAYTDSKIYQMLLIFIPATMSLLSAITYYHCMNIRKSSDEKLLSRTLTTKTDEGYSLNPADLYDAIEKLGYIEHDMKGEINGRAKY